MFSKMRNSVRKINFKLFCLYMYIVLMKAVCIDNNFTQKSMRNEQAILCSRKIIFNNIGARTVYYEYLEEIQ